MRPPSVFTSVFLVLIVLVLATLAAYGFTLTQITVTDAKVTGIRNMTLQGFTAQVEVDVVNSGLVAIAAEGATYTVTLRETGETIASGTAPGIDLPTDRTTVYRVDVPVRWVPSALLAARILAGGETTITVDGELTVSALGIDKAVPFTATIDAKQYIQSLVPSDPNELFGTVLGLLGQQ